MPPIAPALALSQTAQFLLKSSITTTVNAPTEQLAPSQKPPAQTERFWTMQDALADQLLRHRLNSMFEHKSF
mgnify:CR=1 FL=1